MPKTITPYKLPKEKDVFPSGPKIKPTRIKPYKQNLKPQKVAGPKPPTLGPAPKLRPPTIKVFRTTKSR
jgi:hypothetical protein